MKNLVCVINTITTLEDGNERFAMTHQCIRNTHDYGSTTAGIDNILCIVVDDTGSKISDTDLDEIYFRQGNISNSSRYFNGTKLNTEWEKLVRNKEVKGLLYSRLVALMTLKDLEPETTWVRFYDYGDSTKIESEVGSYDKFPTLFGLNTILYDESIDLSSIKYSIVGKTPQNTNELTLSGYCNDRELLKNALNYGLLDSNCFSKVYRLDKLLKVKDVILNMTDRKVPVVNYGVDLLINKIYMNYVGTFRSLPSNEILYYRNSVNFDTDEESDMKIINDLINKINDYL